MPDNQHPTPNSRTERGQSMVEYALIVVLVILGFGLALASTGPAIANVFSNTVFNLVSRDRLEPGATPPNVVAFWATMTWVASQTPMEMVLPTRTSAPPTLTPSPGPPPTSTPITPTNTPTNTPPPSATPTLADRVFSFPFSDSADVRTDWRLDTFDISTENWYGLYYRSLNHTGPATEGYNQGSAAGQINFTWTGSTPPVSGWTSNDNYTITWRRGFQADTLTTINFDIPVVDDGIRIWLISAHHGGTPNTINGTPGTCSQQRRPTSTVLYPTTGTDFVRYQQSPVNVGSVPFDATNNRWRVFDDAFFGYNPANPGAVPIPTECLVVDRWLTGDSNVGTRMGIRRTVPPGYYVIQVDYVQSAGGSSINVVATNSRLADNRDNAVVNSSGVAQADSAARANCDWGNVNNRDIADTPDNRWDEYAGGGHVSGQPAGNRCYLELRGGIQMPPIAPNETPFLTFWDVWDLRAGSSAWVEIAEYDPNNNNTVEPGEQTWTRIDLHTGNTFNYNWTYQTIRIPDSLRGRRLALRFGIQNNNSTDPNRWWIDTMRVDNVTRQSFLTNRTWNLNAIEQRSDFITSGQWALNDTRAVGGGSSWHESPGSPDRNTAKLPISRNSGTGDLRDQRIHSIEWNGFIDLAASPPLDLDGDSGDQILTFLHQYNIGNFIGLEVQYTLDDYSAGEAANWQVVPGGGQLISRTSSTASSISLFTPVTVNLRSINANRFRLRFAMIVNRDASTPATQPIGWWIDEISLQRVDRPRFTPYPFYDPAEDVVTLANWQRFGQWDRVEGGFNPAIGTTGFAYTDSPAGNYPANITSTFELRNPLDLRLDTPQNARATNCNLGAACETGPFPLPTNPVMSFMWRRALDGGDNFFVDWKRFGEPTTAWRTLWAYTDQMTTLGAQTRAATRVSLAWERVEVDLRPIMQGITPNDPGSQTDDDIVIRFRFVTNNTASADGIYLDDIRIEERVEDVWYLWPTTETRTDNTGATLRGPTNAPILGSGALFRDSLEDNPRLFTGGWYFGGGWQAISWERRDGLYSFHESASSQSQPEPDNTTPTTTAVSSFNVLEMNRIIDLRGVDATERPIMYFWSRVALGSNNVARVQIAFEDTTPGWATQCRGASTGGYQQCYEHLLNWSEWETVYTISGATRNLTWNRVQIALDRYAKSASNPGRRIRIRFVLDALEGSATRDGWYIDAISIRPFQERSFVIDSGSPFVDRATDIRNWVTEGLWGLDPDLFQGSGGIATNLGIWRFRFWNLNSGSTSPCRTINPDLRTCADIFLTQTGTNRHNTVTPNSQGNLVDINYNWGTGGPAGLRDGFGGKFELLTGTVGTAVIASEYTFIVASDDGVRLGYVTGVNSLADAGILPDHCELCGPSVVWNIINSWQYRGRTVDMGKARLDPAGTTNSNSTGRYKFIMDYFEDTGNASISMSIGSNTFSFSDSPKQGAGSIFPEIGAVPRSSSSLILNGSFDFRQITRPVLRYDTRYELGGTARVELSTDGGFNWTNAPETGLTGFIPTTAWLDAQWTGVVWNNRVLDRSGAAPLAGISLNTPEIDFNWGNGRPVAGVNTDDFSIRWTRRLRTGSAALPLNFRSFRSDDGIRVWLIREGSNSPNTAPGCVDQNGSTRRSGDSTTNGGSATFSTTGCLLIDNWIDQGRSSTLSATRTLDANTTYTIQVDFYDRSGGAGVHFTLFPQGFDDPNFNGTYQPSDLNDWQNRQHDLGAYAGLPAVGLRFRLDRLGEGMASEGNNNNRTVTTPIDWLNGWWLVNITVANEPFNP